ncbi:unnamed protein product, partial [Ixodes hexagonus]
PASSSSSTSKSPDDATVAGACADSASTAPSPPPPAVAAAMTNGDSKPHTNGGLVSPNGSHVLWDEDTMWILMFDNLLREGTRSPTKRSCGCKAHRGDDEVDRALGLSKASKRASSAPPNRRAVLSASKAAPLTSAVPSTLTRKHSLKGSSAVKPTLSANAGAADVEMFVRMFEDVPRVQVYSPKELEQELTKLRQVFAESSTDWERRVDGLRHMRSLLIAGAADYEELFINLKLLEPSFQALVRDLRSQVVREACITIAYLSQQLGQKLDRFSEAVLPALINLIPNSAKIMSTSGIVTIRFIIEHTHASRLIPVITLNLSSKSKEIRKLCFEFLDQLLHTWPTHTLERHIAILQEAIKKGISDADPEARAYARKAFWGFANHFKEQADVLLTSLDSSKQRMLHGELCMSNSSSSNSLNSTPGRPLKHSVSSHGSMENLRPGSGVSTLGRRSGVPVYNNTRSASVRSNSAIDLGAARRARLRAGFSMQNRGAGASLPRPGTKRADSVSSNMASPERISRSRTKGVSQSQPSSRSGSPSSRLSYATYQSHVDSGGRVRRKSGIPTPVGTSRESSPTRLMTPGVSPATGTGMYERRLSTGSRRPYTGAGERYHPTTITCETVIAKTEFKYRIKYSHGTITSIVGTLLPPKNQSENCIKSKSSPVTTCKKKLDFSLGKYSVTLGNSSNRFVCLEVQLLELPGVTLGHMFILEMLRNCQTNALPPCCQFKSEKRRGFCQLIAKKRIIRPKFGEELDVFPGKSPSLLLEHSARRLFKTGYIKFNKANTKNIILLIKFSCSSDKNNTIKHVTLSSDDQNQPFLCSHIFITSRLESIMPKQNDGHSRMTLPFIRKQRKGKERNKTKTEDCISNFQECRDCECHGTRFSFRAFKYNVMGNILEIFAKATKQTKVMLVTDSVSGGVRTNQRSTRRSRSRSSTPLQRSLEEEEEDNTENLNPEERYNSELRRTTAQIHGLNLDSGRGAFPEERREVERRDAALSMLPPLGGSGGHRQRLAPQNWEEERLAPLQRLSSREASPVKRMGSWEYDGDMGLHRIRRTSLDGGVSKTEQDTLGNIFAILQNPNSRTEHRKQAISELMPLTKDGSPELWDENFRNVLRCLVENLEEQVAPVKVAALRALAELLKRQPQHFHSYAELTLIKIFGAFKQPEREVCRAAEACSMEAAAALPPEQSVRLLHSLIGESDEDDVVIAAIKVMSRLVEVHPKRIIVELLPQMMPVLLKAYDHNESSVRKAAVFCMVTLHGVVGSESMKPHLASLTGCKLKLLNLYIQRSQGSGSTPGSPSNTASSSSNP